MRFPVKVNCNLIPAWLEKLLPCKDDPRNLCKVDLCSSLFNKSISAIKIDSTWKSTRNKRHIFTNQLIKELISGKSNSYILEIGASSGSTSLDLLNELGDEFGKYFVTDRYFTIPYQIQNNATYFYHPTSKHCIMRASDWWIVYDDVQDAFFTLDFFANLLLNRAPKFDLKNSFRARMLRPDLKCLAESDSRIVVDEYDLFNPWPGEKVDLIKVANVLNRQYFSDEDIRAAIANLKVAMKSTGKLIITDNRDVEKVSVFTKTGQGELLLDKELNGGVEISSFVHEA